MVSVGVSRMVSRWSIVVSALDQRPRGRGFESAGCAGCRVATVGQLLFAPWAWAYSTLHPLGVGKWVPAIAGKVHKAGTWDAAWCAPCTWAPLWWLCLLGALYQVFDLYLFKTGIVFVELGAKVNSEYYCQHVFGGGLQCESKKIPPPTVFWNFFPKGWGFLINFLHTYYTIISTLEYKFLFKYLQLWQSYAILSATT